jgi:cysteinyl-tRNA synthetase
MEDVLIRTLRLLDAHPYRVMNITDVGHLTSDADEGEDKLQAEAARQHSTAWDIAARYTDLALQDFAAMHLLPPDQLVKATDRIAEQIMLVQELEAKGYAYRTNDGMYFATEKLADYGKLAHLDPEMLQAGSRVALGEKRSHTDFALWKFSPAGQQRDMEWESPWGVGFPGWHLECSAIIHATLGDQIDIHCGGIDHIPVHHTNEIAQSETVTGKQLAQHWMHIAFLKIDGGKMSKSLGNGYTLDDLAERGISAEALRFYYLGTHYRHPQNLTLEALEQSEQSLRRLRRLVQIGGGEQESVTQVNEDFRHALANDLNTPQALALVWQSARLTESPERLRLLQEMEEVLQIGLFKEEVLVEAPEAVRELAMQRDVARSEKNWAEADRLRGEITQAGYTISDTESGFLLTLN